MSNKRIVNSAVSLAFMTAMGIATPSLALEAKQCLPIAEMNAAMKAEGQRTLILGNREAVQNPTGKVSDAYVNEYANAVTANADGSLGYQLEGDLPRDKTSTSMCVRARLTNVKLFDARQPGIPREALLGGKFDASARELDAKGTRAMLVADTVHRNDDNTTRLGLPMVVFGNMTGRTGSITTKDNDGAPRMIALMADTDYTPAALQRLSGPTQVSMLTPN